MYTTPEKSKNATSIHHVGFVFEENVVKEIKRQSWVNRFPNAPFSKWEMKTQKPAFSNTSGLKSVLGELRFRDGFVWTVGQTVGMKLRLQIPPL